MNDRATSLPRLSRLAFYAAWLIFWLLLVATAIQDYQRDGGHELWKPILWEGSSGLVGTLLLILQRRATRRYDYLVTQPLRWLARQLPWLLALWVVFVPITFSMRHAVYWLAGQTYTHRDWPQLFLYEDIKITVFFAVCVIVLFGVLSYHALLQEKLQAAQADAVIRETRLQQLTQQIQPHFLFNALNTISSLMHSDVHRADAMLIQLADVLRATLDAGGQPQVALETELRLLRGYAALMSERFADRVEIGWDIDSSMLGCQVPVMSLQPLLENVFKHTVERRRQSTHIAISARREGAALVLRLDDDAGRLDRSDAAPSSGIGVQNLRRRLEALHGEAASFRLTQLEPAGVRAEMRLPCA